MTYCLGILSKEGVAGLADTRITSGSETTTAKKIYAAQGKQQAYFIMTSGLRSVRDKAITYFEEEMDSLDEPYHKLYQVVNMFGSKLRQVASEDRSSLEKSGLQLNLYSIVGGQLPDDAHPRLYLLYPQGNWIEVSDNTPYVIIGNTGFGNPVLRRSLHYDLPLAAGLRAGFLSFDATRISACDVGYPLDVIMLRKDTYRLTEHRFREQELRSISTFWNERLKEAVHNLPTTVLDEIAQKC